MEERFQVIQGTIAELPEEELEGEQGALIDSLVDTTVSNILMPTVLNLEGQILIETKVSAGSVRNINGAQLVVNNSAFSHSTCVRLHRPKRRRDLYSRWR